MAAADHSGGKDAGREILTVNAGSSSVRFALYRRADPPSRIFHGKVDRIGLPDTYLAFEDDARGTRESRAVTSVDHAAAASAVLDCLDARIGRAAVGAAGRRVVHGGARFHGLSYAYVMEALAKQAGAESARGRLVFAHLGNGASLAAVHDGASIDTSMGFTPAAGIPMSTRAGDIDPGLVLYCAATEGMTAARFQSASGSATGWAFSASRSTRRRTSPAPT